MLFQTVPQIDEIVDIDSVTAVDFGKAIGVIVIAVITAVIVRRLVRKYLARVDGLSDPVALIVVRGVGYLIIGTGVLLALPLLGFQIEPALILVLVGAVLLFFAARPLMEDFSAGMVIQTRSPFAVGDVIRHGEHFGTVRDIDGRATVILTPAGETVRIRNTTILTEPIINGSADGHRRSVIDVGVAYGTDLDRAVDVLLEAVSDLDLVLKHPIPRAVASEYDDSAILLKIWIWHRPPVLDEVLARDAAIRSIDRALKREGIVIAFPQRDIWLRNSASDIDSQEDSP